MCCWSYLSFIFTCILQSSCTIAKISEVMKLLHAVVLLQVISYIELKDLKKN